MKNRVLLTLVVALWPALSFAQDLNIDVNGNAGGLRMRVRGPADQAPPPAQGPAPVDQAPPYRPIGHDDFKVDYSPLDGPREAIAVLSPEGAQAQVWNEDGTLAGNFSVPFNFKGRPETYYRFVLWATSGEVILDRKLEVKKFVSGTVQLRRHRERGPGPQPQIVVVQQAPPPPAGPSCMPAADFDALLGAIDNESFSSEKLSVLSTAAPSAWFTIDQVGRLVDAFAHSSDKVEAVRLTRPHIIDRPNGFKLYEHFTFSSDKDAVKALLK